MLIPHSSDRKLILLSFTFFFLINIVSSGGHLDWWDGTEAFLVTESMALKNTPKLDPSVPSVKELHFYINHTVYANKVLQGGNNTGPSKITLEPVYTVRSLLLSAIAVPFYHLGLLLHTSPIVTIGLLVNSLFNSLTAVVLFCTLVEVYWSRKIAFLLSLIFSVCSFIWPYNSTLWVQPLQALTLASAAYFIIKIRHYDKTFLCHYTVLGSNRKRFHFGALAGFFLGLSVFAHPTSLIFIPGFLIYAFFCGVRRDIKNFLLLVTTLGIMVLLVGLVNYARFGTLTEFGYGYYSSLATHDGWRGLLGLLISPGAGLIFYFPLAILLPLGAKYMYKENKGLLFLCAYIIIANWIYVGTLSFGSEPIAWSGGVAWGPRYLIPILPFVIIILGSIFLRLNKKRPFLQTAVVALCVAGFYVNLSAILIWFQYGLVYGWQQEGLGVYPNSLDIMTWYPLYSPIVLHTKALLTNYVSGINPAQYLNTSWSWMDYGNAPCPFDLYIYCNHGVIVFLVFSFCIFAVAVLLAIRIGIFSYPRLSYRRLIKHS